VLIIRVAIIERLWLQADRVYSAGLAGIDLLPRGTKLAVAYPSRAVNFVPVPELHLAALAIARREAFVPILFALPTQQPVVMRPLYLALGKTARPEHLWSAFVEGDASELATPAAGFWQYDFIAFTDNHVLPNRCLRPVFVQPTFKIFAVVHAPSCMHAEG
jgi:hypothetical protein